MKILSDSGKSVFAIAILCTTMLFTYGIPIPEVGAATDFYSEEFTTTEYLDESNTNVTGWGDGEISLAQQEPTLVSTYDTQGLAYDICIEGDLAYVPTFGAGVRIINISDPSQPEEIGYYDSISNAINIDVQGSIAYVAAYYDGIVVLNVSDPTNPAFLSSWNPGGYVSEVVVDGNLAFAGWGGTSYQGFRILNVTNPKALSSVAFYNEYDAIPRNIVIDGNIAYLSCEIFGLKIVNITNPRTPEILDSDVTGITHARGINVDGDYLYLTGSSMGLRVVNITNPHDAFTIGYTGSTQTQGVSLDGNFAYIGTASNLGFSVVNITNPINPVIVWNNETPGYVRDLKVHGEYLYVAANDAGVRIYRIADSIEPTFRGEYLAGAYDVCVEGDIAYVCDWSYGLRILNVTDVSNPTSLADYTDIFEPWKMDVQGNFVYILETLQNLEIINVTDPRNPSRAGYLSAPLSYAKDIDVEGNYAYITDIGQMHVVNVTDPTDPVWISECTKSGGFADIVVSGNYAYLSSLSTDFTVVNVTDPMKPTIVGSCDHSNSGYSYSLFVEGNYVFSVDTTDDFIVYNITDPLHPQNISEYSIPGHCLDIWIDGNYAYIANYLDGLTVLNITIPQSPELLYNYPTPNTAWDLCVDGSQLFIGCNTSLQIVDIKAAKVEQYAEQCIGQSEVVLEPDGAFSEIVGTLRVTQDLPSTTSTLYYLSADNGTHWEAVTPGVGHSFTEIGNEIKWRVKLTTTESLETPRISSLNISLSTRLDNPILLSPADDVWLNDPTPLLDWASVSGALEYLLQFDTSEFFDSIDFQNITITGSTSYTPISNLSDETWYWRVAAIDSDGDRGAFSQIWSFSIDTVPPGVPSIIAPSNNSIDANNTRLFAWTHATGYDSYTIEFDSSEYFNTSNLRNIQGITDSYYSPSTPLADGVWYWHVKAVDIANNHGLYTEKEIVTIDTTSPSWDEVSDQHVEYGYTFTYSLQVTDLVGILSFKVNDTTRFIVSESGHVYSNGILPVGIYGLEITVTDLLNHPSVASFSVIVEDTTGPSWTVVQASIDLEYGEPLELHLEAYDLSGIDHFTVSDTTHFSMSDSGVLTNNTILEPGTYTVTVRGYDPYGNAGVAVTITILVSEPPPAEFPLTLVIAIAGIAGVIVVVVVIYIKKKS